MGAELPEAILPKKLIRLHGKCANAQITGMLVIAGSKSAGASVPSSEIALTPAASRFWGRALAMDGRKPDACCKRLQRVAVTKVFSGSGHLQHPAER
jgi:hypothetical protein